MSSDMLTAFLLVVPSLFVSPSDGSSSRRPPADGPGSDEAAEPVHPDLAPLRERWRSAMEACGVPAMAMVLIEGDLEGGEVVHRVTLGRRDPEREAPVTKDTIFYIASATKPYVAFVIAQLAEQGRLELDAPVKRYLPRLRLADPKLAETITVRDLLCHRHGLQSTSIVLLDAYTGDISEDRYYHFLEQVESPGRVSYSNLHFTLAGRVIEAVSGENWREYLAEHLFRPAGMTRTTGHADWMYAQDDVAMPAIVVDGLACPAPLRKSDRTMHAAGGIGTSIEDLGRWLRLQLGRGTLGGETLLGREATEASWVLQAEARNENGVGRSDGFAFGWQRGHYRGHLELSHGGGYVGAASYVCFLPELGLGLGVVATGGAGAAGVCQLVAVDVFERLLAEDEIRDPLPALLARAREELGRDARRRAEEAAAVAAGVPLSLPLASYAGDYRSEWLGGVTLRVEGQQLLGRLGEVGFALAAPSAEAPAADTLRIAGSGPFAGTEGRFELDSGRVLALTLDLDGPVRFAR